MFPIVREVEDNSYFKHYISFILIYTIDVNFKIWFLSSTQKMFPPASK